MSAQRGLVDDDCVAKLPMFISTALSKDAVSIGYDGVGAALTTR
jgi:hypothetical protein